MNEVDWERINRMIEIKTRNDETQLVEGRISRIAEKLGIPEEQVKITVEVGAYGRPVFEQQERQLDSNELYICVDSSQIDANGLEQDKLIMYNGEHDINFVSVDANAKDLYFLKDNSTDQVIMTNVIGYSPNDKILDKIIFEAIRVLKKGGKLVITETLTPEKDILEDKFNGIFDIGREFKSSQGNFMIDSVKQDLESMLDYDSYAKERSDWAPPFQLILKKI